MSRYFFSLQWRKTFEGRYVIQWFVLFLIQVFVGIGVLVSPWVSLIVLLIFGMVLSIFLLSPIVIYALILLAIPSYELTFLTVGAIDLKLFHIFTIVGLSAWFVQSISRKKLGIEVGLPDIPILFIIGWALATLFWTPFADRGFFVCIKIIGAFLSYFVMTLLIRDQESFRRILSVWVLICLIWSMIGTYNMILYGVPDAAEVELLEAGITHLGKTVRVSTLFGKPNDYAFFLSIGIIITIIYARLISSRFQKALLLIGIVLMVLVLMGTFSRKSWIGLAISLILMGMKQRRILISTVVCAVVAIVFLVSIDADHYLSLLSNRVMSLGLSPEVGMAERAITWRAGMELFVESPLIGNGAGSFFVLAPSLGLPLQIPHNFYLLILVEYGLVGMALFVYFILSYAYGLINILRKTDDQEERLLAFGLFAIFVSILFQVAFKTIGFTNPIFISFIALVSVFIRVHTTPTKVRGGSP